MSRQVRSLDERRRIDPVTGLVREPDTVRISLRRIEELIDQIPTVASDDTAAVLDAVRRGAADTADELDRQVRAQRAAMESVTRKAITERETALQELEQLRAQQVRLQERLSLEQGRREALRARQPRQAPEDIGGQDLRPDPGTAQIAADLVAALREFRVWAGRPSFREMAARCGGQAAASTMCAALKSDDLPDRLAVIDAIIVGCGGSEDDRRRFATAWRRLVMTGRLSTEIGSAAEAGPPARPRTPLRAVPVR
jgi:hypothetical protein